MAWKKRSLDRVLGRVDNLAPVDLANLVQRLARERSFFEAIFDSIREGILVVDGQARVEYANEAATRMVGFKEEDIGKVSLWRLIPGLRESLGLEPGQGLERQSAVTREYQLTYPEPLTVRMYIVALHETSETEENRSQFAVILSDVTQEVESTREQIESEKVSSILLLAAGVAHELGNPLNSLTIHLQLMERQLRQKSKTATLDKLEDSLTICRNEVERLDGIIRNFLEAIRPKPPDFQDVNLLETLEEVLSVQGRELQNRELTVDVEAGPDSTLVKADRNQVKQVFFNIVRNAMEAMSPGGQLRVKAYGDDDYVFMRFGDSGEGIPRDALSHVFRPFHTTKKGGHGLGLMVVQRIMRDHGGQIGIESQEGVGTIVTLQFPRRDRRVRLLPR